jgi:carboxyl-terminal processing protease
MEIYEYNPNKHKSMKLRVLRYLALFLVVVLFSSYSSDEQPERKEILLNSVIQHITMMHFQPLRMNDSFSAKVYDLYIKRIDYSKKFLTNEDLAELSKYKFLIDDEINQRTFKFYNTFS